MTVRDDTGRDRLMGFQNPAAPTGQTPANDPEPFDGSGAGDWGDQWIDHRLRGLFQADEQIEPSPRLAELLRRLELSMERDGRP